MAYRIEQSCSGCGMCVEACPRDCIYDDVVPVRIDDQACVDCGVCEQECPLDAVAVPPASPAS
jgi:ferredoxin